MNDVESSTKHQWIPVKDFSNKKRTILIRVTACTLPPRHEGAIPLTHYTWELLRINPIDGNTYRHFQIQAQVEDGVVSIADFEWDEFIEIQKEAQEWVREKRQEREDLLTEKRIANMKGPSNTLKVTPSRFDPMHPRGLKTLSKEDWRRKTEGK